MKKQVVILILCGLMLSLAMVSINQVKATDSDSSSQNVGANTTAAVFSETFEGEFPGTSWTVGDWNATCGYDYWDDTNYRYHAGSWSGWCAQSGTQELPYTLWSETFEGAFPSGSNYYVGDWNSVGGLDYWDDTNYRSHGGSWSGWCAQSGSPTKNVTIWTEDFEGAFPGTAWTVGDENSGNGLDYWDDTNYMSHTGSWSAWCAQVGTQAGIDGQISNSVVHQYDDNMGAYMYRSTGSLAAYTDVWLQYSYYSNNEPSGAGYSYDYAYPLCIINGAINAQQPYCVDASGGWRTVTASIPTVLNPTAVGFYFHSNGDRHNYLGVYIDDVVLFGTPASNTYDHMYDNYMDAYVYKMCNIGGFASVSLSYWYWLDCETNFDCLQVMYYYAGSWYYPATHTGHYGYWQYNSVAIPTYATAVGFRFHSDQSVIDYGAYLDDITMTGIWRNSYVSKYDNYMDAYMYRAVSLGGYTSVSLSYSYWLNCEPSWDYLEVMYYSGGVWYYTDRQTGNSGGWQSRTVTIPTSATYVGFRFHSDASVSNYEGAYLDDIVCTGTTPSLYTVNLESRQDSGASSNLGGITFAETTYGVPTYIYREAGTYTVQYNAPTGYQFKSWQTTGGISVSSTATNPTTATVTGAGTLRAIYRRVFFADGFESGSFSAWTGTGVTYGETRSVTSAVHFRGTYSALFTSNGGGGTERAYCYKTIPYQPSLYARAYFRVATSGIRENGDSFYMIVLKAGTNAVAFAGWKKTGGVVRWFLQIRNGTSYVGKYSSTTASLNAWYRVELRWVKSSVSGLGQLWVNGVLVCSITGRNTATYGNVNRLDFGLPQITYCLATKAYLDCVKVGNTYIGAEP